MESQSISKFKPAILFEKSSCNLNIPEIIVPIVASTETHNKKAQHHREQYNQNFPKVLDTHVIKDRLPDQQEMNFTSNP